MSGHLQAPFSTQQFDTFEQWANKASSWLTCHNDYNNTEHGDTKGWRGHHFTAMCFDAKGRRCHNGAHFQRARDEDAFPVWWIWPDQIPEVVGDLQHNRFPGISVNDPQSEAAA